MSSDIFYGPEDLLDESQIANADREYRLEHGTTTPAPFYYSSEELDSLGIPGYDSDRDDAEYWNRMQNARLLGLEITKENVAMQPVYPVQIIES